MGLTEIASDRYGMVFVIDIMTHLHNCRFLCVHVDLIAYVQLCVIVCIMIAFSPRFFIGQLLT